MYSSVPPSLAAAQCVRDGSQVRDEWMKPSKEDNVNRAEEHDRPDDEEPQLVPPDLDIDEGDEAKKEGAELPPAMPPKV
jgi:hypothetical protein